MKFSFSTEAQFGVLTSLLCLIYGLYSLWVGSPSAAVAALVCAVASFFLSLNYPMFFKYPCRLWIGLGVILGKITTPVLMCTVFFLVFTPVALIFRVMNRDQLELRPRNRNSMWLQSSQKMRSIESLKNQF